MQDAVIKSVYLNVLTIQGLRKVDVDQIDQIKSLPYIIGVLILNNLEDQIRCPPVN